MAMSEKVKATVVDSELLERMLRKENDDVADGDYDQFLKDHGIDVDSVMEFATAYLMQNCVEPIAQRKESPTMVLVAALSRMVVLGALAAQQVQAS
jgi:hypothetical protein